MLKRLFTVLLLVGLILPAIAPARSQETPTSKFPVTIKHKYGETTLEKEPQRVLSLGYTEQDFLLALGIKPIAVRYWYGDTSIAIRPWAETAADGAKPEILNMEYGTLNYEAILALKPDFISAITSGITQEEYDTLSKIAPVLAQPTDYIDFGTPWQVTMTMIGEAVGKSDEAAEIVERVGNLFKTAREENPEFEGKSVAVVYRGAPGQFGFWTDQDPRGRFFTDLGFVVPQALKDIAGANFYSQISAERIDLLDRDLIAFINLQFVEGGAAALEADPLFGTLKAVKDKHVLYLPKEAEDALQYSSPLSLEFALKAALPKLQEIFGKQTSDNTGSTTADCQAGLRAVKDVTDATVCVPEHPQRVAALMEADLDALITLGVKAVATTNGRGQNTPPRYLNEYLDGIEVVGAFYRPNLEALLALKPDLILFGSLTDADTLAQLNKIAPTVNTFQNGETWQTHLQRVATIMNMTEKAEDYIAAYDKRVEELRAALGENAGAQFIVARWSAEGPQVMAPITFSSLILQDLQLTPSDTIPDLQEGEPHTAPLSLEALTALDVDWAFIGTLDVGGDAQRALEAALDNALFKSLKVVQNKHVVLIDGSMWTSIGGPIAATKILDDVEKALVKGNS